VKRSAPARRAFWELDAAGALFCAAISLAAYFLAFEPVIARREAFADKENQLRAKRREVSRLAATELTCKNELASAQGELAEDNITLRPCGYVNRQVASLTELINQCGLKADSIELGTVRKGVRYNTIPSTHAGCGG